ncbi:ParB/Srx family N-terminal domain-containing protein [Bartonella bovis]|uniref:ParB/Sulfiredoxin domain-containing protein n=1 Tax=Bartonella bovis 91-4 TaxID=1094491 RepID=N6VJF8_9HYPH|nr:ParB/Srx family N-terminal domain-containing protein [Bartonella bovis]ENN91162.1 hypothetical protein BBbe_08570 [Bartonella bovis 91-4]
MVKTAKVSLKKLEFDPENPRIPRFSNEKDAINFLCNKEQILELAEDIAENGISPCEKFIVLQDREKYIVVEGNRRLIALKFLDNPNLAPERLSKKFSKYSASRKVLISSVECVIVSNRKEANHWIETKHSGQNKGKGVKPWDAIQKARYFPLNVNRFAYLLFNRLLEDVSQDYNISTVTRFISKPIFFKHTGIYYDKEEDKLVFLSPYEENSALDNFLKQFVRDILERELDSRSYNNKESIEQYFEELFEKFKLIEVYSKNDIRKSKNKKETKHSEKQCDLFINDTNKAEKYEKQKLSCYDEEIASQLNKLGYIKPISIYYSVKKLNADMDTPLLYIAFSCLFEGLTRSLERSDRESFDFFLKKHPLLTATFSNKSYIQDNTKDILKTLTKIREEANAAKHACFAAPLSYTQIISDMQTLKPLLMQLIAEVYEKEKKRNKKMVQSLLANTNKT